MNKIFYIHNDNYQTIGYNVICNRIDYYKTHLLIAQSSYNKILIALKIMLQIEHITVEYLQRYKKHHIIIGA